LNDEEPAFRTLCYCKIERLSDVLMVCRMPCARGIILYTYSFP
jgi:hypothetical protein